MIKVCHMTSAHAPEDLRIFRKECVSLANAGYEVFLVEQGDTYDKLGVHIAGIGQPKSGRLGRMVYTAKSVYEKALQIDADIYHFHDPELIPYGLKLKKQGKKVIFDSHERYTEQIRQKHYLPKLFRQLIAGLYGVYEKAALKKLDAVVFPCTMEGKNPFEGMCKRVSILANYALLEEFYNNYREDIPKITNQVCYVGGLTENRGITADVIGSSKANAVLALAGPFDSQAYETALRAMPEFSCVDYRGMLGREDIVKLLAQSNVGLCTLLNRGQYLKIDTFGIKVYEYLSMGLPVILSRNRYNQEMVEKYQFGLCVDPENTDELAEAIRYLLDNSDAARKMGENGRRAIKEAFNWSVEEKKLLALYEDILK